MKENQVKCTRKTKLKNYEKPRLGFLCLLFCRIIGRFLRDRHLRSRFRRIKPLVNYNIPTNPVGGVVRMEERLLRSVHRQKVLNARLQAVERDHVAGQGATRVNRQVLPNPAHRVAVEGVRFVRVVFNPVEVWLAPQKAHRRIVVHVAMIRC